MKVGASVRMPGPIQLRIDTQAIALQVGADMHRYWQAQTRAGRQPDGSPMPRNKDGRPLGVEGGSLLQGWRVELVASTRGTSSVRAAPGSRGRQLTALRIMMLRGVRYQGLTGASEQAWRRIVARVLSQRMRIG